MQRASHLRIQVLLMKSTLKTLDFSLKQRLRLMLLTYFLQITKTSAVSKFSHKIRKNYEDIKENNNKELETMEKEVKNLKKSQTELELITKNYSKREIGLRNKLETLRGRGSCEKMKLENKGLRLHLEEMDKKMIFAFKELNLVLDTLEEIKKKKLKKLKKKAKVCIKNKHAGIGLVL